MYLIINVKDNDFYSVMESILPKIKEAVAGDIHGYKDLKTWSDESKMYTKNNIKTLVASNDFKTSIISMMALEQTILDMQREMPSTTSSGFGHNFKNMASRSISCDNEKLFKEINAYQKYFSKIDVFYQDDIDNLSYDNSEIFYMDLISGYWGAC